VADRIPTEHEEQRELVRWFRHRWPLVRIMAIPNGGARNIATATRLKAEGVSAGVPDLFVPAWRLWVEMKRTKDGRASPQQKDWIEYLRSIQYTCLIAHGAEDAKAQITAHLENCRLHR